MAAVPAFATVSLVLRYTLVHSETGISASATGTLTIATFLALTAPLASRLRRQVRLFLFDGRLEPIGN